MGEGEPKFEWPGQTWKETLIRILVLREEYGALQMELGAILGTPGAQDDDELKERIQELDAEVTRLRAELKNLTYVFDGRTLNGLDGTSAQIRNKLKPYMD